MVCLHAREQGKSRGGERSKEGKRRDGKRRKEERREEKRREEKRREERVSEMWVTRKVKESEMKVKWAERTGSERSVLEGNGEGKEMVKGVKKELERKKF